MRPPTASASSAAGSAVSSAASSPLTSIRSAWNVRLAGCPPVRRAGCRDGVPDQLGQPRGRGDPAPSPAPARSPRRSGAANFSSPYTRRTRARSAMRVGVDHLLGGRSPGSGPSACPAARPGRRRSRGRRRRAAATRPPGRTAPRRLGRMPSRSSTPAARRRRRAPGGPGRRTAPAGSRVRRSASRVPVEPDQDRLRVRRRAPPRHARRGRAWRRRAPSGRLAAERGGEQLETPLEQHRHVRAAQLPHVDPHCVDHVPYRVRRVVATTPPPYRQIPIRSRRHRPSARSPSARAPGTGEVAPGTRERLEISRYVEATGAGRRPRRRRQAVHSPPGSTPSSMLGEVVFALGEVGLPGLLVPDLHPGARADHHEVAVQPGILPQVRAGW